MGQSNKLHIKANADTIALRWEIADSKIWYNSLTQGVDIYRKDKSGNISKLNDSTVRAIGDINKFYEYFSIFKNVPIPKDSTTLTNEEKEKFKKLFEKNENKSIYNIDSIALKAHLLLFSEKYGVDLNTVPKKSDDQGLDFGNDALAIRKLFHTIMCISSKSAAFTSGLLWYDTKFTKSENYTYYVVPTKQDISKYLATATYNGEKYNKLAPKKFMHINKDNYRIFAWRKPDTLNLNVPVYDIYKSEFKNGPYQKINKDKILAVITGANSDSNLVYFNDEITDKKKTYYYKVQGLDIFGDVMPMSEAYTVKPDIRLKNLPQIDRVEIAPDNRSLQIFWSINKEDLDNVAFFQILKSNNPEKKFKEVSAKYDKDISKHIDKDLEQNNYYMVSAIGKDGDTLNSFPKYVRFKDSIPPVAPVLIEAICDSNAIVKLRWRANKDTDIAGYKIHRANYLHEEFSRVAEIHSLDTTYTDTVSLKTLEEQVYYKIFAIDHNFNSSPFSNYVKCKKPDIIPPSEPIFYNYETNTKGGIKLFWYNSSSSDVVKTNLFRRLENEPNWHLLKTFVTDSLKSQTFTDVELQKGDTYEYTLQAVDDDNLKSNFAPILSIKAHDDGKRPEIKIINSNLNVKKHTLKITWQYKYSGVKMFQIYKGVNNKPATILQSLDPNTQEYYDEEIGQGNIYTYKIKAVYTDGAETPFSKDLIIKTE